jgi:hypothetical protein
MAGERSGTDRRRLSPWTFVYGACRGRRVTERRAASHQGYVDRYPWPIVLSAVALFTLGLADAYCTLALLEAGAREANPVMEALLRAAPGWFVPVKLSITALGVVLLVLHKNFFLFRRFSAANLMHGLVGVYVCLMTYEGILLWWMYRL